MGDVKHIYQGVEGIDAIADKFELNASTLRNRLWRGMSIEEAINLPVRHRPNRAPLIHRKFKGIKYPVELSPFWKLALGMEIR